MLPQKGIKYVCKISYNQYEQGKIYVCNQDGYLIVNGSNYRISDEVFFENYFYILNDDSLIVEPLTTFSKNLTKDKIVLQVMNDLNDRSRVGVEKYGVTLERDDLSLKDWLHHAYEKCLDQANYLKRAILEIENKQG